jgi:UDP-N-acetylmuramate--alanine ligase
MVNKVERIHLIGIGGAGMNGIAEVLVNQGYQVSGSDLHDTDVTRRMKKLGMTIHKGHASENVAEADVVVYSSAIKPANVEMVRARELKIPVIRRADMLGELMRMKYGIGIAGTHGKTTTTSMIGTVLTAGRLDPTIVVGGKMLNIGSHAHLGKGQYMVVEADEFDRSFLKLLPVLAIITTLEADHLDCYKDLDDIKNAFVEYANHVPFYGAVILCLDETSVQDIIPRIERTIITYGCTLQARVRAENVSFSARQSRFTAINDGKVLGALTLQVPGLHNIKNALAAIAVGLELKIPFKSIKAALEQFTGVKRRFDIKGEKRGVMVVDDYAHHPTEIEVTLKAARHGWQDRRIIVIFQPHLYSRTRDFCDLFARAFFQSDILIITEIYPAREEPIPGVSGAMIAHKAQEFGHQEVHFVPDKNDIIGFLKKIVRPKDMVLTMGAGDIWEIGEEFIKKMK